MAATTAWADVNASKYDTTIEAQIGVNKYNQDTETLDSMLWKFTADKNYLAQVEPLAGSYDYVYVSTIVKNNDTQKNGISGTEAAAKGSAAIYSINGTKMAGSLKTLKPGIYVICADGKTKRWWWNKTTTTTENNLYMTRPATEDFKIKRGPPVAGLFRVCAFQESWVCALLPHNRTLYALRWA